MMGHSTLRSAVSTTMAVTAIAGAFLALPTPPNAHADVTVASHVSMSDCAGRSDAIPPTSPADAGGCANGRADASVSMSLPGAGAAAALPATALAGAAAIPVLAGTHVHGDGHHLPHPHDLPHPHVHLPR